MIFLDEDVFVPALVFAIPIVAILGGVVAGIVRTVSTHRLMETAIRERMALAARGVDPASLPSTLGFDGPGSIAAVERFRAQGLLVAGFVTTVAGVAWALVGGWSAGWEMWPDWTFGWVVAAAGIALLAGGALIWPRGKHGTQP